MTLSTCRSARSSSAAGCRRSVGNVLELAGSIERVGLLHPLVLNSRKELVSGGRRLEAVRKLFWETVPCRVVSTLDDAVTALRAERDENTCRADLTSEELVDLGNRIEAIERPEAARRREGVLKQNASGNRSGTLPERAAGDTRDKVAAAKWG